MELQNPYDASFCENNSSTSRIHFWQGHTITVQGKLLPSMLWLVVAYTITIDDADSFVTAQHSVTEDFRWTFMHNGETAAGHFQTYGIQNAIRRKYRLSVNDNLIAESAVWLNGWWFLCIAIFSLLLFTFFAVFWVIPMLQ